MFAAAYPLRDFTPGAALMAAQIVLGGAVYVGAAAAFDLCGLRALVGPRASAAGFAATASMRR